MISTSIVPRCAFLPHRTKGAITFRIDDDFFRFAYYGSGIGSPALIKSAFSGMPLIFTRRAVTVSAPGDVNSTKENTDA
jgi:hypothetical protein